MIAAMMCSCKGVYLEFAQVIWQEGSGTNGAATQVNLLRDNLGLDVLEGGWRGGVHSGE